MPYFFMASSLAGTLPHKADYGSLKPADPAASSCTSDVTRNNQKFITPDTAFISFAGSSQYTLDNILNRNSYRNLILRNAMAAPPTIICPENIVSNTDPGLCKASKGGLAATTNDPDGDITTLTWIMSGATVAASPISGINNLLGSFDFNRGTTTVTYRVTDAVGSSASCSFTVIISDKEVPSIICPSDAIITIPSCSLISDSIAFSLLSVSDNCGIFNFLSNAPAQFPLGTTSVIWTAKDINGNSNQCTQQVTVINAPPMNLVGSSIPVRCFGENNGTATVEVSEGSPPYTYSWNTVPVQTTSTATNLLPGNYIVTVTDFIGCTATASVTVTQPAAALTLSVSNQVNVDCYGNSTGSVIVAGNGGTPGYQYSIDGTVFQASGTFLSLPAGAYTLTVKDSRNCINTTSITITQPATAVASAIISQTNVACLGSATGSVTDSGSGGTPPYLYNINGGAFQAGATFNNLGAGVYNIVVKDANNCSSNLSVTITQAATLFTASITSHTNVLCSGQANGSATATASGGTSPYTYSWNTVPVQTTAKAINLTARTYTVTITDAAGCIKTANVGITQPTPISISITKTNVACFGDSTGTATASASGGTPPYIYAWLTVPIQTTATVSNLPAGTYTVAVFDSLGCFKPAFVTITQPATKFTASITNQLNVICSGNNTGSITVAGGGGTPPYQYNINGGAFQATGIFNNLTAGVYSIIARDTNNCEVRLSATITEPASPLTAAITSHINVLCSGQANGSATVMASGGTAPYTYSWNTVPVQTLATAINLTASSYTVTVTDAAGCTKTAGITITQPKPLTIAITKTNVSCFGDSTGTATALASGGTPPYTYAWLTVPIQTTATVSNLPAGTYTVAVFDSSGCFKPAFVTITQPATKFTASITNQVNVICSGNNTGSVTVAGGGGTPPYQYNVNGGTFQSSGIFNSLAAGVYTIIARDTNNCEVRLSATITEPATPLTATITAQVNFDCLSGTNGSVTIEAAGGTPAYQYSIDRGAFQAGGTFTNLAPGNHIVSVQDANTCEISVPVEIKITGLVLAVNDTISTPEDIQVSGNVMTNDQALCYLPIIVTSNTAPLNGTAIVNPDGTFMYTPALNYNGFDSFTYTLRDNSGNVSTATVSVQVIAVNDPPVLFNESVTVIHNQTKPGNVLLNGDYDPDSTVLAASILPVLDPVNGSFVIAADGSFTYTPNLNYTGNDMVVVSVCDAGNPMPPACTNDTIFITVLPPNQPPVTINEKITICNDISFVGTTTNGGTVFNGDSDPENNLPLTLSNVPVQGPTHGVFSITDVVAGTFNYTPDSAYSGVDYAIVSICDSGIPVGCSNDTVYFEIFAQVTANAGLSQMLCNSDVATLVGNSPAPGTGSWAFVSGPNTPSVFPSTGNVAEATGLISSQVPYIFSYSVNNGSCSSADTMIVINYKPVTPSYAGADQKFCSNGANITATLAASAPVDGTGSWSQLSGPNVASIQDTTLPNTDVSNLAIGDYVFQWLITNGVCQASADIVNISVSETVVANAGADQTILPGSTATLSGSATGGSGMYAWNWSPARLLINASIENPATLALSASTNFTLTALDIITGCTGLDTVQILMDNTPNSLVAVADYDTTLVNSPVTVNVLANDINPEAFELNVSFCGYPAHGFVVLNSDKTITYTPYSGYEGDDSFCYKICDSTSPLLCADTMVYIHVKKPSLDDLYAYNGISPNSDGNNDVWKIRGIEKYPDNTVIIFNRWGDKLREFAGYNNTTRSWDGKNENGKLVPNGTYFYILDVKNVGVLKGWIYVRGEK